MEITSFCLLTQIHKAYKWESNNVHKRRKQSKKNTYPANRHWNRFQLAKLKQVVVPFAKPLSHRQICSKPACLYQSRMTRAELKRLWHSPLASDRQVCVCSQAVGRLQLHCNGSIDHGLMKNIRHLSFREFSSGVIPNNRASKTVTAGESLCTQQQFLRSTSQKTD